MKHHRGPDRAVCLYSLERIHSLRSEGYPIDVGTAGASFIEGEFVRIAQTLRPGWSQVHARVLAEGQVHFGDLVDVRSRIGQGRVDSRSALAGEAGPQRSDLTRERPRF